MSVNDRFQIESIIGHELTRAKQRLFERVRDALADFGLRPAQFSTLCLIEEQPGIRPSDLARALDIEPPRMVLLLNRLEEQGLAVRVRNESDRRSFGVYPTRKAEALLQEAKAVVEERDRQSTAMLTDDERQTLLDLLRKINRTDSEQDTGQ